MSNGSEVLTYVRALPHSVGAGFMLDEDFAPVAGNTLSRLPRENAVELSRLVCRKCEGIVAGEPHPMELLLKLLYQTSLARGWNRFYIVVEDHWIKPFARRFGLPFTILGAPFTFPDGTRTVAAAAAIAELQAGMRAHSWEKYRWYNE